MSSQIIFNSALLMNILSVLKRYEYQHFVELLDLIYSE